VLAALDKLRSLARLLDEDQPAPGPLYVDAPSSVVDAVVREIATDPNTWKKHLLFGARGGGKSSQMGEIFRRLEPYVRLDLDLDRMGIGVAGITAFDLLYIIALAGLKELVRGQNTDLDSKKLFRDLEHAYRGKDPGDEAQTLEVALTGLAGFGSAVGTAAAVAGLAAAPVGMVSAAIGAVAAGLRLRSKPAGVVAAASQQGRSLQQAVRAILSGLRRSSDVVVVLLDGLEKVNGHAAQWFEDTFENTRLLIDAEVTIVLASPPCPFWQTNAASQYGYVTHVLYGYGTENLESIADLLRRRIQAADLHEDSEIFAKASLRFARDSGGHPRHAVGLLKRAVQYALNDERDHLLDIDLDAAVMATRRALALGLTEEAYAVLHRVANTGYPPNAALAAQLFADGRILADPPDETGAPVFRVHPLLVPALERFRKAVDAARSRDEAE
jgi:hypothetical protein